MAVLFLDHLSDACVICLGSMNFLEATVGTRLREQSISLLVCLYIGLNLQISLIFGHVHGIPLHHLNKV